MQVAPEKRVPPPIPTNVAKYPVPPEVAALNIDEQTGEPVPLELQNAQAKREREVDLSIVDWKVLTVTSRMIIFQLLFSEPDTISVDENSVDSIYVNLNLEDFASAKGYAIPAGSMVDHHLPPQLDIETGEFYERAGSIGSWIYLGFIGVNGLINSLWDELDYTALFDAVEGPQAIAFIGGMGVALPANVQTFLNSLRGASSFDTEEMINEDGEPTADEVVFED